MPHGTGIRAPLAGSARLGKAENDQDCGHKKTPLAEANGARAAPLARRLGV